MTAGYWDHVQSTGFALPPDRPLADLTAELTAMLGSPDPAVREALAHPALTAWIDRGTYDDLLSGLGDGMAAGLQVGLGESGSDTVFRRSWSAVVLGTCLARDATHRLLPRDKVLEWGDHLATWLLDEQDTRGEVPGKGRARAVGHGAVAIGALARSPHVGTGELTVLLDVLGERTLRTGSTPLDLHDVDRIAAAVLDITRRDLVSMEVLDTWLDRIAAPGEATQSLLRALFVQLSVTRDQPSVRPDLLLALVDALRTTNPDLP